jgi:hypothetical protein
MKIILACIVLSASGGWCQQRDDYVFFEHKTPSAGVPFVWPSTWADASSITIKREDVLRFVVELHRDNADEEVYAIQGFRFVPLEKDKFYLVADADVSGRDLFGSLQIVRCEGAACIIGSQATEAEDLDTDLVDVGGDGVFQVITKETAAPNVGMMGTVPLYVYLIRSLVGGDLVDVSSKYPEYFKDHILPRMEADGKGVEENIASMDKPQPLHVSDIDGSKRLTPDAQENNPQEILRTQEWKVKAAAERQYVQDDYHRRVLGEKTAGLENALKWARADDAWLKGFGVKALEPIDSPVAAAELSMIANSGDSSLAEDARNALIRRAQARLAAPPTGTEKK